MGEYVVYNVFSLTERDKMVERTGAWSFCLQKRMFLKTNEYVLVALTGYFSLCPFILKQMLKYGFLVSIRIWMVFSLDAS